MHLYILLEGEGEPLQPCYDLLHLLLGLLRAAHAPAGGSYIVMEALKGPPLMLVARCLPGPAAHPPHPTHVQKPGGGALPGIPAAGEGWAGTHGWAATSVPTPTPGMCADVTKPGLTLSA